VTTAADLGCYLFADVEAPWRNLRQVLLPAAEEGQLPMRLAPFVPLASHRRLAQQISDQVGGRVGTLLATAAWSQLLACG
jgi:hypothetical protein